PSEAGGDQAMVADRFPTVAVTLRGGPGGAVNVKTSAEVMALVPFAPVTVTSTGPAAWAGLTAVSWVSETKLNEVAAVEPNFTPFLPLNPDPLIVPVVPPAKGPALGLTEVTVTAPDRGPTVNDHVYGSVLTVR